mmetsp:Transcript_22147/g.18968  ORF Transcript_22147/g.18968 Transcript_22147/m.18968 type:complete len:103 (+) Transcript_22147:41-349(+)
MKNIFISFAILLAFLYIDPTSAICDDKCEICTSFNNDCVSCFAGYAVNRETHGCMKCPDNCAHCSFGGNCDECRVSFVFDGMGGCTCPDGSFYNTTSKNVTE